ncbi:hypothetical protein EV363DRAFT_1069077, partial [Boletus edulis]
LESLIDNIYAGVEAQNIPPPEFFKNRTILAARNTDVESINLEVLRKMHGDEQTYFSADE